MTSLLRAWALSLLFCLLPAAWAAEVKLFAQDKAISASYDLAQLGWVKRHAWIRLAPEALSHFSAGATTSTDVSVQLFDDTSFVLHEQSRESVAQGSSTIRYSLRNDSRGNAVFTATQDSLVGTITTGDHRVYRVMPAGGGLHRAEELDHSKFPECADHSPESLALADSITSAAPASPADGVPHADNGAQIDVMVVYTPSVLSSLGGSTSAVQSLIATAISETNSGYSTSGVNTKLNLVHTALVNYNESGGFSAALNAVTGTNDGQMDEVHGLRNTYAADLVVLLINDSSSCGVGWLPTTVSTSNQGLGFSVTHWDCATGYYSFGHEIGHNMGARHDRYVDGGSTPYSHGHGYANKTVRIRSIMAYNNDCSDSGFNCTRVNHWSASDRMYNGSSVIGDSSSRNNDALNASVYTIANYRTSASTYTLGISKAGTGTGTIASVPAGINCGSTCSASYAAGTQVTLTAQAASGSSFAGWGGACTGTSSSCSVTMSAARSVTASFNVVATNRMVTLSKSGTGTGSVSSSPSGLSCPADCSGATASFASTAAITLTAQAASGSTFAGWSGACSGSNSSCTIPAGTSNANATASFNTSSTGGGVVTLLNQSNLSGSTGNQAIFTVQVPAGASNLIVSTSGGTGDVDLYTRLNAAPTASAYDCESVLAGNNEVCGTATPQPGTYYILLSGYSTYSGVTLRVTYRQPSAKVTLNVAKAGTGQGTVVSTSSVSAQLPSADTTSPPRIVGGEPAQLGAWPWQVKLSITKPSGTYLCGGSLISDQWVLTAAHCIDDAGVTTAPANVSVRAGSLQRDSGGVVVGVSQIIKHHAYEYATYDNDIALLRLSSALPLSNTINVVPPLSATQESQLAATNTLGVVTGWGATSSGGSGSSVLLQAQVALLTSSDCAALSSYAGSTLTSNMICAGYPAGGKDSCQGDSGGPLVVPNSQGGHVLAGIVSWGYGCAAPGYPGVYTRVANYQSWLQKHTQLALGAPVINCGSSCSATVDAGTTVTLLAQASGGSSFTGWSGACSGTSSSCTVTLSAARSVTANFTLDTSNAYTEQVVTMFGGYFGRPAASAGQRYYQGLMAQSNGNYRILVDDFYKSAETQAIYGGLTVSDQIRQVFQQLFGRQPLDAGLSYWVQQVSSGQISVPEIAYTVAYNAGQEDTAVLNAKRRAALAFTAMLETNSQYSQSYTRSQIVGRLYLACVKSNADADAAVAKLPTTMGNMAAGIYAYVCP